jgi:hypothetical protein
MGLYNIFFGAPDTPKEPEVFTYTQTATVYLTDGSVVERTFSADDYDVGYGFYLPGHTRVSEWVSNFLKTAGSNGVTVENVFHPAQFVRRIDLSDVTKTHKVSE